MSLGKLDRVVQRQIRQTRTVVDCENATVCPGPGHLTAKKGRAAPPRPTAPPPRRRAPYWVAQV